jgi:hypothetical protein
MEFYINSDLTSKIGGIEGENEGFDRSPFPDFPFELRMDRYGTDEGLVGNRSHSTPTHKLSSTVPKTSFPLVEDLRV